MADDYLSPAWWSEVMRDAFAIIDPILEETAKKVAEGGYIIGQQPPTYDTLMQIADAEGPEYAGTMLRNMLVNPSTSQAAAKIFDRVLTKAAERNLLRQPESLRYASWGGTNGPA